METMQCFEWQTIITTCLDLTLPTNDQSIIDSTAFVLEILMSLMKLIELKAIVEAELSQSTAELLELEINKIYHI